METLQSKFQEYLFTPGEVEAARSLTDLQRCYWQNELSVSMLQKAALRFESDRLDELKLRWAELDGRIGVLVELLQLDPSAVKPKGE